MIESDQMQVDSSEGSRVCVRLVWPYGGSDVRVAGSYDWWAGTTPLAPEGSARDSSTIQAVVLPVPLGYTEYAFSVDGRWLADPQQARTSAGDRNWLFARPLSSFAHHERSALSLPTASSSLDASSLLPGSLGPIGFLGPLGPRIALEANGDAATKARVAQLLHSRSVIDMVPESGRVVAFDTGMPVQQAFHVLYEQGIHSAPLWDSRAEHFVGVLASSDFIQMLRALQQSLPLESEMYSHTIAEWRDACACEGKEPRQLVSVDPELSMLEFVRLVLSEVVSNVPVLAYDPSPDGCVPQLLHMASLSGVLAFIAKHFRGAPGALPLLSRTIRSLPIGTWVSRLGGVASCTGAAATANADRVSTSSSASDWSEQCEATRHAPGAAGSGSACGELAGPSPTAASPPASGTAPSNDGKFIPDWRQRLSTNGTASGFASASTGDPGGSSGSTTPTTNAMKSSLDTLQPVRTASPTVSLMVALEEMMESGVGSLPVVDDNGRLKDLYARSDVTSLAHESAYARVSLAEISVGQALLFASEGANKHASAASHQQKVYTCTRDDQLLEVLETLAVPDVRRVVCVEPTTRKVEGVITLSDMVSLLLPPAAPI